MTIITLDFLRSGSRGSFLHERFGDGSVIKIEISPEDFSHLKDQMELLT